VRENKWQEKQLREHIRHWVSTPVKIFIQEAESGGRGTSIQQRANL